MKRTIWVIILLLVALARTVNANQYYNEHQQQLDALFEQIEEDNMNADLLEWEAWDEENAGTTLDCDTVVNPFN